jgi:Tfp pilus assembly protein PilF
LACAFLIPERDLEKASFYLRRAIEMNVWNESTNARTNFGALLIEAGELERAKAALVDALSQPDEFSEGEASLLLAQIFRAEGNESEAAEYYRRAIASGHPTYAEAAESELLKMDENTGPAEAVQTGAPEAEPIDRPNFCGNCGTRFAGADQNFCGNCGNSRGN